MPPAPTPPLDPRPAARRGPRSVAARAATLAAALLPALTALSALTASTARAQLPGPGGMAVPPPAGLGRIVQGVKFAGDSAIVALTQATERLDGDDPAAQAAWLRAASGRVRRYDAAFGRTVAGAGGGIELSLATRMRGALRAAADRLARLAVLSGQVAALTPRAASDDEEAPAPDAIALAQLERLGAAMTRESEQLAQATGQYSSLRTALRRALLMRGVVLPAFAIGDVEVPDVDAAAPEPAEPDPEPAGQGAR